MRQKIYHRCLSFAVMALMMMLAACLGGTSGSATGNSSTLNPVSGATSLSATIDSVTIPSSSSTGGVPVIKFTVTDQNGNGVTGLTGMRYIVSKLIEAADGEPSYWQSYINTTATKEAGDPGTEADGTTAVQATTENDTSSGGTLTELGNGEYRYTFATDLSAVTTAAGKALDVTYEPSLTHRFAIQVSTTNSVGDTIYANPTYDFQPSSGRTTGITTREMALTSSCNECHGTLAMHGGGRVEVKYCVTCHNPGTTDPNSGNVLDMALMVHKMHRGASLPSVSDGDASYTIWGYNDAEHDYSTVVFPQDVRHCEKCHDPSDTDNSPDAGNYASVPYIRACNGCHDDIVFDGSTPEDWQTAHTGGVATNADCATCHGGSGATVDGRISGAHVINTEVYAEYFQYNIIRVENTAPGEYPSVTFSVTNPIDGTTYGIKSDPQWTGSGTITVKLAWDTADYNNTDSGSGDVGNPAQPVSINGETASTDNGDGTFTVTSTIAIPDDATGSGVVMIDGRPVEDFDGDGTYSDRVPVTNAVSYFAITDSTATERREVVSIDKCNNCHGFLTLHGSNRNNKIEACVICHNPNATDIVVRPAVTDDDDDDVYDDFTATGIDSKREESIDFKYMIHAIHAGDEDEEGFRENGIVVYGYGGSSHDYSEVRFPGDLKDCLACHQTDTYILPLEDDILATTIGTGDAAADLADPTVDENISPIAAVCSSCHDSAVAQTHMEQNGSDFDGTQATITAAASETCLICHGTGDSADIKTVHEISE